MAPSPLARWIDLAAELLTGPADTHPMATATATLSDEFDGATIGLVDYGSGRAQIDGRSIGNPDTVGYYLAHFGDMPLARHFVATNDPHPRVLEDAARFRGDPAVEELLARAASEDLLRHLFIPLTAQPGIRHRWIAIAGPDRLDERDRQLCDTLRPLLRALDLQSAALGWWRDPARARPATALRLTSREIAVLVLVSDGLTATAIGHRLGISRRTVCKHVEHIHLKLGVSDKVTAVRVAREAGILPSGQSDHLDRGPASPPP